MTTAKKKFSVSQSKAASWLTCRAQYHFAHVMKIAPKAMSRPLKFGNITHKLLEVHAEGGDPFQKLTEIEDTERRLFRNNIDEYGEIITDLRYIMREYFSYWGHEPFKYIKYNGKYTEHVVTAPLTNDIDVKIRVDGMAVARKLRWLVEHKTGGQFPSDDHRWRNLQSSLYLRVLDNQFKLDGTCWDYIRSKPPTRPQVLKTGGMSERALDTLPSVVKDTLKKNKMDPADYPKLISDAKANLPNYFQRIYTRHNKAVSKKLLTEFTETAKEMQQRHLTSKTKTIGRHCEWCSFEPLCRADLQGGDVEFLIKKNYQPSEYHQEKE